MPSFPYIIAFVRHGRLIACLGALLVLLLCGYAAWRLACPDLVVLGLIGGGIAFAGLRLLVEIVQAIAETLLPR